MRILAAVCIEVTRNVFVIRRLNFIFVFLNFFFGLSDYRCNFSVFTIFNVGIYVDFIIEIVRI